MTPRRFRSLPGVLTALGVAVLFAGCGSTPSVSGTSTVERPDEVLHGDRPPGYIFKSLPRLVATSKIVVVGRVQSARRGARVVPDDTLYHRKVIVEIEEQFHGTATGSTIVVHQSGYNADRSFELRELPWLYPGDRAVYFLAHAPEAPRGHYDIIAAPGRLVIEDNGTVSTKATDPIARDLDGQSWSTVAQRIREAVRTAKERNIRPLPPGPY